MNMKTREVTAADMRGPEDRGSTVKKGSLVLLEGKPSRVVRIVQKPSGMFDIYFEEERKPSKTRQLMGPTRTQCNDVPPKRKFLLVIEGAA